MAKISSLLIALSLIVFTSVSFAQKKVKKERVKFIETPSSELIYDNHNYISEIKSAEFYNTNKEQSFPIITLGSNETVILKFDDLRTGSRNIYYTLVHCDAEWKESPLTNIDYLDGFIEDRINDYKNSYNTYQPYIHYELTLPSQTVKPKIAGNYLLKIYEDSDQTKLLITKRLFVISNKVNIGAQIVQSNVVSERNKNQKINFTIYHPNLNIQNPYEEVRVVVMQNARNDKQTLTKKPLFIRNNELVYSDVNTNDFTGGNEFRKLDTRTFRFKSQTVANINLDSLYHVLQYTDADWNTAKYTTLYDEDGKFYILNQDGSNPNLDADYGYIHFTLNAEKPATSGDAYIVGQFNNYQKNDESRMSYNETKKQFYHTMLIKQGVVDYHYTWADKSGKIIDDNIFDGTFFQTENDYQLLVYYKRLGSRFEELVAFTTLNTTQNINK